MCATVGVTKLVEMGWPREHGHGLLVVERHDLHFMIGSIKCYLAARNWLTVTDLCQVECFIDS